MAQAYFKGLRVLEYFWVRVYIEVRIYGSGCRALGTFLSLGA